VHACLVAAANAAYLSIASRKSEKPIENLEVHYTDCIDLRRFYPESSKTTLGCHITMYEQNTKVSSSNEKTSFWQTAKQLKEKLHQDIKDHQCLELLPVLRWGALLFPINSLKNKKGSSNYTTTNYLTTNMGDVTKYMEDVSEKEPVQVTDIFRSVNCEHAGHSFNLTFHTFRNRFYLSIDYFSNKMTDHLASRLFDQIKMYLLFLTQEGTVLLEKQA